MAARKVDVEGKKITIFGNPRIEVEETAEVILGDHTYFFDCDISVKRGSRLILGSSTSIKGSTISLDKGAVLNTAENVFFEQVEGHRQKIVLSNSKMSVGAGSRIRASISTNYDAQVRIGRKTYINQGSEIRSHRSVLIGDYVLISYEVDIFDNNTHDTDWQSRHRSIEASPPGSFIEKTPPASAPISIGNNCWIGKRAAILKGVSIGDRSIVALSSIVTKSVPEDCLAYGNPAVWKKTLNSDSSESTNTADTSGSSEAKSSFIVSSS